MILEEKQWYKMKVSKKENSIEKTGIVFFKVLEVLEEYNENFEPCKVVYVDERISLNRNYSCKVVKIGIYDEQCNKIIPYLHRRSIYDYTSLPTKIEESEAKKRINYSKFGL